MTHLIDFSPIPNMFLLTCLLRGMTSQVNAQWDEVNVSTHMPLARHDCEFYVYTARAAVSTHMPLARHDRIERKIGVQNFRVSTHMPLARHDCRNHRDGQRLYGFYSHASCEA